MAIIYSQGKDAVMIQSVNSLSGSLEDYLEAIFKTAIEKKIVRVKDITKLLNVKTSSAIKAIKILETNGFLVHEHYGYIDLTEKGLTEGKVIYAKHTTLRFFLTTILGVSDDIAEHDACLIEHCLSEETYVKILTHVEQWKEKQ